MPRLTYTSLSSVVAAPLRLHPPPRLRQPVRRQNAKLFMNSSLWRRINEMNLLVFLFLSDLPLLIYDLRLRILLYKKGDVIHQTVGKSIMRYDRCHTDHYDLRKGRLRCDACPAHPPLLPKHDIYSAALRRGFSLSFSSLSDYEPIRPAVWRSLRLYSYLFYMGSLLFLFQRICHNINGVVQCIHCFIQRIYFPVIKIHGFCHFCQAVFRGLYLIYNLLQFFCNPSSFCSYPTSASSRNWSRSRSVPSPCATSQYQMMTPAIWSSSWRIICAVHPENFWRCFFQLPSRYSTSMFW